MSGPINPRARPRYPVTITGEIGPVRRSLLDEAKAYVGGLAATAGQRLDMANALLSAAIRKGTGTESLPDATNVMQPGEALGLTTGGEALIDSANGIPLARMDRGLMSLQVRPEAIDAAGIALPVAGFAGKVAADTAFALPGAVAQAGREFLEAGATGTRIWAGPKSATWRADDAANFETFDRAGGSKDGLWTAFKTARLKDDSLIQEIDDSKATLKADFANAKPLSEVIDHPDFAAAYPQLAKDVKVNLEIDPEIKGRGWGSYDSGKKELTVWAKDATEALRLMLHEMQHSVSRLEGRATGGSPNKAGALVQAALDDPSTSPELREKLKKIAYDDFEAYQRMQDEVVARNVEARRDWPQADRETFPPMYDRDPADWIINRDDTPGISMALAPDDPRMPGLPDSVALPDGTRAAVEPISDLRRIALDFMREKWLDPNLTTDEFRRVDPERGKAIADVFEAMKNDPQNPVVQASYRALVEDVKGQWDALQKMGYKFSFIEQGMPDPYAASPRLAIEDLKKNKHLWVYPTDAGFGNADAAAQSATNPLLAPTGVKIGDRELVANDLFRIVHDVWGHAKEGVGFRADGEENAWLQHLPTFRPQARMALTTETRGQNSWLNFGPHGEKNRTASSADTVFAPQKVGDLPAWVMDPNGMPPQGPVKTKASLNIGLKIGDSGELNPDEALAALRGLGIDVTEHSVMQSGTEPTLVVGLGRALSPAEAEMLARAVKQEAIAQKVGKKGELFGPGKDKWGPFNDEYFLELGKRRAQSGARKQAEMAAKKEGRNVTTADLLKDADAEVQGRVQDATAALSRPGKSIHAEDESNSLFDRSTIPQAMNGHPGVEQKALAREQALTEKKRAEIDAMVEEIFSGANRDLIARQIERGRQIGGDTYYPSTYPLRVRAGQIGADFDTFIAANAATSFRNALPNNFASGSLLRYLHKRGYDLSDFSKIKEAAQAIAKKRGHNGFSILPNHVGFFNDIQSGKQVGFDASQKGAAYYENLRGNFDPMTLDTHEAKGLTVGSRFFPVYARKGGFATNEYGAFEGAYKNLLGELFPDVRPASGQAGRWFGGGDITGLKTEPGDFLYTMEHMIQYSAEQLGLPTDVDSLRALADLILAGDEIMVPYFGTKDASLPKLKSKRQKGFINPALAAALAGGGAAAASLPLLSDEE